MKYCKHTELQDTAPVPPAPAPSPPPLPPRAKLKDIQTNKQLQNIRLKMSKITFSNQTVKFTGSKRIENSKMTRKH